MHPTRAIASLFASVTIICAMAWPSLTSLSFEPGAAYAQSKKKDTQKQKQKEQPGRNISFSRIVRPKVSTPRFRVQALPSGISTSGNQTMTIRSPISWHSYRRMETRIWNYSRIQAMAGIFSLAINASRRLTTTLRHQHEQIRVLLHAQRLQISQ